MVAAMAARRMAVAPGYGGPIQLGEVGSDGFHRSWIMLFPEGRYEHPQYGKLDFSRAKLAEIARQFDARVRHIDIALDANHDQDKATGWLERLELRAGRDQGQPSGLWGLVRWTPYGAQLLKDQLYRYFSPEFGPWEDPATGKKYDDVLMGGALTNRPFLKEMPAVTLADGTAVSRRPWGGVNKSMLPRSAFLDPGDPDKKSTWRLPVYEGAGPKDADGCYTKRGPLNINGVRAALAALGGAHTGEPMTGVPAGVKAKLEGWLKKYGGDSAKASEPGAHGGVEASDMALEFDEDTQSFADGEDDEEGMQYDDGDTDADDGFDSESDTHGAMTTDGHSHGKFGDHSHDGDGDHSDAPMAKRMSGAGKGGAKKASEPREPRTAKALREAWASQSRQLAEMREQLYKRDVADTLAGWDAGKFQFSEAPRSAGKSLPMVALSRRFTERYSAFMLGEGGAGLDGAARKAVNELIETALSAAVVDLSTRGASYDQERRKTTSGGRIGEQARMLEGGEIVELAERRLQEKGKRLAELSYDEMLALLVDAERESR